MRDFHLPGRSPVYARNAAVATSHPLATLTALEILKQGGNAVDAAVAAVALLGVIEPAMTGIGGDCFVLYAPKGKGKVIAMNGSGKAPAAAKAEWFVENGQTQPALNSPHGVTVPGAVAAWDRLVADHGTRPLAELLQPAIKAAEDGFVVAPKVGSDWAGDAPRLAADPVSSKIVLVDGKAPAVGSIFKAPLLAATLKKIAAQGRDGFYKGDVAEDMVNHLRSRGGLHTMEDFAAADAEYVEPIKTSYKGLDIYECPPNGQGITALLILNILSGFDLKSGSLSEADRIHLLAEATKLAYHQRDDYVGDPRQADVPVEKILSPAYADALRVKIDMAKAGAPVSVDVDEVEHKDTTYMCVVDKDGNAISFINSIFHGFGSSIVTPKTGVVLHNRGLSFKFTPGHPNSIAPGKRPMHTIIPAMAMKGDVCVGPFGVMGGQYQSTGHAGFVTNVLDRGMDVQEAMDAARTFAYAGPLQVENGVSAETVAELEKRGHTVERAPAKKPIGGSQAIWRDLETGVLCAGSDPRKDGCAMGY
ncbi:gamma-glutamyltransferase [Oceanibaculum pacificum]|uniref:Glutathione hydrolase proenzyme n=1 Tax=Oceanibaculum pacificum TaxID=580166 RepID=A0A154WG70_9PROT|nr:gamma-glutamyltransferase [Oceanibaculum pacificum]KZD12518.1 gamma-glutamyltransferase [Oceanibaculum pacificum]